MYGVENWEKLSIPKELWGSYLKTPRLCPWCGKVGTHRVTLLPLVAYRLCSECFQVLWGQQVAGAICCLAPIALGIYFLFSNPELEVNTIFFVLLLACMALGVFLLYSWEHRGGVVKSVIGGDRLELSVRFPRWAEEFVALNPSVQEKTAAFQLRVKSWMDSGDETMVSAILLGGARPREGDRYRIVRTDRTGAFLDVTDLGEALGAVASAGASVSIVGSGSSLGSDIAFSTSLLPPGSLQEGDEIVGEFDGLTKAQDEGTITDAPTVDGELEIPATAFCQNCGKASSPQDRSGRQVRFFCSPTCRGGFHEVRSGKEILSPSQGTIVISKEGVLASHCWACGKTVGTSDEPCSSCGKVQDLVL